MLIWSVGLLFWGLVITAAAQEGSLTIVTSEFAPFNYVENGESKGFCTEIVREVLKELKLEVPIQTHPWSRAYQIALKQRNTLIYTIARTPAREELFRWVGVLISGRTYLFSRQGNPVDLKTLEDSKPYTIGAVRNGIRSAFLGNRGFTNLDLVKDSRTNAVKLLSGRIDLWLEDELSAVFIIKTLGHSPGHTIRRALALDLVLNGYLAFSKNSDPQLVAAFKRVLDQLIISGVYMDIKSKYL